MVHVRGSAHHDASGAGTSRPDTFDRWRRLFRGQESELRHLRRWLTGLLPDCPERDDLISVAVELGTNAVQHTASGAGGWFTVAVTRRATVVRLDVADEGGPCSPQVDGDPMSDCGRGLVIVRALAESCGVRGDRRGRTVWAEIAWAPADAPEPAAAPARNDYPALRTRLTHPAAFRKASAS